jgi:hypothetical protein
MSKGNNRKLKVYYGPNRGYKYCPVIHLSGKYLTQNGFKAGDEINVTLEENRIVISKIQKTETKNT